MLQNLLIWKKCWRIRQEKKIRFLFVDSLGVERVVQPAGRRDTSGVLWEPMCAIYSELDQWYMFGQTVWKVKPNFGIAWGVGGTEVCHVFRARRNIYFDANRLETFGTDLELSLLTGTRGHNRRLWYVIPVCQKTTISKVLNSAHRQDRTTIYSGNPLYEQVPSEGRDVAPESTLGAKLQNPALARAVLPLPLLRTIGFH
jgi:hypothetical protein